MELIGVENLKFDTCATFKMQMHAMSRLKTKMKRVQKNKRYNLQFL